jgi:hypothetical protein
VLCITHFASGGETYWQLHDDLVHQPLVDLQFDVKLLLGALRAGDDQILRKIKLAHDLHRGWRKASYWSTGLSIRIWKILIYWMILLKVYIILKLKVMPFLPPPALSVDTSQGRDSKKKKNPAKKEQLLKTQI